MSPAIARFRRAEIEERISALIDLLDALDGEPDLEPSLGWPESRGLSQLREGDLQDDREEESDFEDGGDTEPNGDEIDCSFIEDEFTGRNWS